MADRSDMLVQLARIETFPLGARVAQGPLSSILAIRLMMEESPTLQRTPLSRKLCELFNWTKPNGELKDMTCRVALLRMQGDGLITLPPSRMPGGRSKPHFPATPASDEQAPVMEPVHELAPLTLRLVAGTAASRLWNEFVQRLETCTPRARWQEHQRKKNLQLVNRQRPSAIEAPATRPPTGRLSVRLWGAAKRAVCTAKSSPSRTSGYTHYATISAPSCANRPTRRYVFTECLPLEKRDAAKRMGIMQPKVSDMMRGDFTNLSERKLMDCLTRLGYDIEG